MKVVLIGDSIRMGYLPLVRQKLTEAEVWGPAGNCRHSLWALDHFDTWVSEQEPDILHVNFGIHDASLMADGEHQILLSQYRLCMQRFVARVQALDGCRMIWATITPRYKPDANRPMADWEIDAALEQDAYNAAAAEIVNAAGIPVNDLHQAILDNDFSTCLTDDGCHMTERGNDVLSDAVIRAVRALP
jgi:lysophospholipase L1-like esterase